MSLSLFLLDGRVLDNTGIPGAENKLGRFEGARSVPGAFRKVQEGPGAARRSPGTPRSSSEVTSLSSRKIGKMISEMRLAASERR